MYMLDQQEVVNSELPNPLLLSLGNLRRHTPLLMSANELHKAVFVIEGTWTILYALFYLCVDLQIVICELKSQKIMKKTRSTSKANEEVPASSYEIGEKEMF